MVFAKTLSGLRERLQRDDAKKGEAVLAFKDAAALHRFLAKAEASGWRVFGRLDALNALRVGFDDFEAFGEGLADHAADFAHLDGNLLVYPPTAPEREERDRGRQVPFDNGVLDFLGAAGDRTSWGAGIGVAVLDSGVAAAGGVNAVRYIDIGMGVAPGANDGHGTAVASLVAGRESGLSPGSHVLSIRVTGADGTSDAFTLSQGIVGAVDAGARVINVSMGAYGSSALMDSAIAYAASHGAILVASAGNDQAGQLTWPAADPRVVSVGAVDAMGQQVRFSNAGDGLSISAPGYGVPVTWMNGQAMSMDGTSAGAPLVSGAIAAVMSLNPGYTPVQAWEVLRDTASDQGPAGQDRNFGHGVLNLGWAMHRNDPAWIDPALGNPRVDIAAGTMEFLVQNRSGAPVGGLELELNAAGEQSRLAVPLLAPGAVYTTSVPFDRQAVSDAGSLEYRSRLILPAGLQDVALGNNGKMTTISLPR